MEIFDPVPETVEEALKMWDGNKPVFSIEMGGLGPGYEMAIQGLAFECMREIRGFAKWDDKGELDKVNKMLDEVVHRFNDEPWGGFSGAQVGAAKNLAAMVCRNGYRAALNQEVAKYRRIQVNKRDLRGLQTKTY